MLGFCQLLFFFFLLSLTALCCPRYRECFSRLFSVLKVILSPSTLSQKRPRGICLSSYMFSPFPLAVCWFLYGHLTSKMAVPTVSFPNLRAKWVTFPPSPLRRTYPTPFPLCGLEFLKIRAVCGAGFKWGYFGWLLSVPCLPWLLGPKLPLRFLYGESWKVAAPGSVARWAQTLSPCLLRTNAAWPSSAAVVRRGGWAKAQQYRNSRKCGF